MKFKKKNNLVLLAVLIFSVGTLGFRIVTAETEAISAANAGEILINEFAVAASLNQIELYNTLGTAVDLTGFQLLTHHYDMANALLPFANITDSVTIPANGYLVLNSTHNVDLGSFKAGYSGAFGDIFDKGDEIALTNSTGHIIDVVGFGGAGGAGQTVTIGGGAPSHSDDNADGVSVARISTTGTNATNWNVDRTPTWGAANDAPGVDLGGTDIVINEVNPDDDYIELHNTHSYDVIDLENWFVNCPDDRNLYLSGSINPGGFVTFYTDGVSNNPLTMYDLYDIVYLYNSTGERVDQMGWGPDGKTTVLGKSWNRYPDGTGGNHDGNNNATSGFTLLNPSPGSANTNSTYATIQDVVLSQSTVAIDGSVDVAAHAVWSNGTVMDTATVSVDLAGTDIPLTYDAGSEYFNGTVDFTGYTPVTDSYGFYHTTELEFTADGGSSSVTHTAGVLYDLGYGPTDTVIMFDEAHEGYYSFSDYAPAAEWTSVLYETDLADYVVFLDDYDYRFRMSSEVFTDVDLLVVTSPDSDLVENWLLESEADAMLDYVEAGGALWFSGEGGTYSDHMTNGLDLVTSRWGIEWSDGYYQDPVHNAGQDNHGIPSVAFPDSSVFDNFDAFGADEFYFNGMIINHTTQYTGATVTEVVAPRDGSNFDSGDVGYEPDFSPITHEYALAYLVENGSGEAFVLGSSSLFGHYDDFQDGVESAQFALNVFCYLLNVSAVQFPTLTLVDSVGAQTVYNNNTAVTFSVDLSSSIAGATLSEVEVAGTLEGDLVEFTAAGGGVYTATWDATFSDAGTY
ncbi:MAG: lamin tail domain-containing protein, partial [Candidatus Kariarchaeaceae archaeon]